MIYQYIGQDLNTPHVNQYDKSPCSVKHYRIDELIIIYAIHIIQQFKFKTVVIIWSAMHYIPFLPSINTILLTFTSLYTLFTLYICVTLHECITHLAALSHIHCWSTLSHILVRNILIVYKVILSTQLDFPLVRMFITIGITFTYYFTGVTC